MPIAAWYLIIGVAVALLGQTSFDRKWIQQVEYLNGNMLRVRLFSKTVEFRLSPQVMLQWEAILPAHSIAPVIM